jgi:hypothetical protein
MRRGRQLLPVLVVSESKIMKSSWSAQASSPPIAPPSQDCHEVDILYIDQQRNNMKYVCCTTTDRLHERGAISYKSHSTICVVHNLI